MRGVTQVTVDVVDIFATTAGNRPTIDEIKMLIPW